jgi:2-hydroxycyclohexanecarboxyl-CoA dehydrogenase
VANGVGYEGRVAVVTGGASGMGRSICQRLAARGDRVAVLDIEGQAAELVAEELRAAGGQALAAAVDVTDRPGVDDAVAKVRGELGPIGILVTSAGLVGFEKFADISEQSWQRIIDVNLTGTFHCVQSVIPDMVAARWGRIVTISSSSAQRGSAGMIHYTAAKAGVIAMTRALSREYAPFAITVNTIPPSGIETPMQHRSQAEGHLPPNEVMARNIPLGHLGTGDDIAAACAFLTSEEAGFISGQTLGVNGGSVT